jgi:hypothetical protein
LPSIIRRARRLHRTADRRIAEQRLCADRPDRADRFSKQERYTNRGVRPRAAQSRRAVAGAATEGARLRFRAVMMTSFAFILGLVPLVLAQGASELSRRAVSTGIFAGMIAASLIGIFLHPDAVRRFPKAARARTWKTASRARGVSPDGKSLGLGWAASAGEEQHLHFFVRLKECLDTCH